MKATEKVRILSQLTTRDEAGRHFTQKFSRSDLSTLEAEGLITITKPVHPTGIPYSEEHWSVEVSAEAVGLIEANPEDVG